MKKKKKDDNEPHYIRLIYAYLTMDEPIIDLMTDLYYGGRGRRAAGGIHPAIPMLYLLYLLDVRPRHDE